MGFFFGLFLAIVGYIGYRVYRHPFDARADPNDPSYKVEFRMLVRELLTGYLLSTISDDSSIFEDKSIEGSTGKSLAVTTARSISARRTKTSNSTSSAARS
ncbi:hypothetical protein PFISCL1PPCAC_9585, partial [Pristionchus fissidentatus]